MKQPREPVEADSGSPANLRECPLLGVEPSFLPGTSRPLETLLSLFDIYFPDRLLGAKKQAFIAA